MARTTIYFVSDLHGSSVCFRKFINAAPIYGANVLVLGADLAGKAIQQIVRQPGGRWSARFAGVDGPRWFLRAVFHGAAVYEESAAAELESLVRGVVVVRGGEAMAPPRTRRSLRR